MKKIFVIVLLFISVAVSAQENPLIENGVPYDKSALKPFLSKLHDENDYVLTYRYTTPYYPENTFGYFILTKKGNTLTAYNYSEQGKGFTKFTVPPDSLKLLWKAYTDFNIFKDKTEKELFIFCPDKYLISNDYTYELILLSKDSMKILNFIDVEYYNRVCPGMKERQDVINCVSLINYVISSVIVHPVNVTAY